LSRYFRAEISGLARVPDGPVLFVGNHNSGIVIPEAYLFAWAWCEHTRYRDPPLFLAHDIGFRVPWVGRHLGRFGLIRASHESAGRALAEGRKVVVFPGGEHDSMRPSRDRDRVIFAGRKGFVRLALATNAPV